MPSLREDFFHNDQLATAAFKTEEEEAGSGEEVAVESMEEITIEYREEEGCVQQHEMYEEQIIMQTTATVQQ